MALLITTCSVVVIPITANLKTAWRVKTGRERFWCAKVVKCIPYEMGGLIFGSVER